MPGFGKRRTGLHFHRRWPSPIPAVLPPPLALTPSLSRKRERGQYRQRWHLSLHLALHPLPASGEREG